MTDGTINIQHIDATYAAAARKVTDVLEAGNAPTHSFLIDDEQNILQAAAHDVHLQALYVTVGTTLSDALLKLAQNRELEVFELSAHVSKELFGKEKRSRIFALAQVETPAVLSDLDNRPGDIVILDGVKLAGNIGAIIRTSCALNAAGVVLIDSNLPSILDRRLIRASRGTVFALPVVIATAAEVAAYCEAAQVPIVSLGADAAEPLSAFSALPGKVAVLMGSERHGPSSVLDSQASRRFSIPMNPAVESLNVSVAAGIALYSHQMLN